MTAAVLPRPLARQPAAPLLEIVRGIFLKGVGVADLWRPHLWLLGLGLLFVGVAAARFQKRIG